MTAELVRIPSGMLLQGSNEFYPEETPVRPVEIDEFAISDHQVTNAEFRRFVKATGHVTVAELAPDPVDFPGADSADLVPGSLVFVATQGPVPLDDWTRWWQWIPGADWRHPAGPGSTLDGRERHPVVHVGHSDAMAYAAWAGLRLPTEEEWEFAARGGLVGARYPWGDEFMPRGKPMANTWHGDFPWRNDIPKKHGYTVPVGSYPPNGYGLFDVAGNVWEWTTSPWREHHAGETGSADVDSAASAGHSCCAPSAPTEQTRMVTKGGSHLCAPSYCHRYRPAARQGQTVNSTTGHLGFRVAGSPSDGRR